MLERTAELRLLHTLEGNAGMMGLSLLAECCHQAEDALAGGADAAEALPRVLGHPSWATHLPMVYRVLVRFDRALTRVIPHQVRPCTPR